MGQPRTLSSLPSEHYRNLGVALAGVMEHEIWTIGHSVHPMEEFLAWLKAWNIELLADVRSFPGSRRVPWFNKEVLPAALGKEEVDYVHIRSLGGRRKVAKDSPNTVWRHPAFRGYADYMLTDPGFGQGLQKLKEIAGKQRTCIMCSEVLWWRCHRSMIADKLKSEGWRVWHIEGIAKAEEHPYTAAARLKDGQLCYGPEISSVPFARPRH